MIVDIIVIQRQKNCYCICNQRPYNWLYVDMDETSSSQDLVNRPSSSVEEQSVKLKGEHNCVW